MSLIKERLVNWPALTDFFDNGEFEPFMRTPKWSPAINVVDNKNNFEIEVSAPGLSKDDFHIDIDNGIMTITGKTEKVEEEKEKNYMRKEFSANSFVRSFTLPENIKQEEVKAKYRDGILRLKLEKDASRMTAKKKVIAIE